MAAVGMGSYGNGAISRKKFGASGSLFIKHNSKKQSGYQVEIVIVIIKSLLWNKEAFYKMQLHFYLEFALAELV